jgi:hypothetical protein
MGDSDIFRHIFVPEKTFEKNQSFSKDSESYEDLIPNEFSIPEQTDGIYEKKKTRDNLDRTRESNYGKNTQYDSAKTDQSREEETSCNKKATQSITFVQLCDLSNKKDIDIKKHARIKLPSIANMESTHVQEKNKLEQHENSNINPRQTISDEQQSCSIRSSSGKTPSGKASLEKSLANTTLLDEIDVKKQIVDEKKDLNVYVLQVSGGAFPVQLALLSEVYEAKKLSHKSKFSGRRDYAPDLVLAASGGNVATYIALAGDWSPEGIERSYHKLDAKMFSQKWLPDCIDIFPKWVYGIIKGTMYREGYGASQLFASLFTPASIQRTEIWTGTYNVSCGKAQFFCNLDEKSSIFCRKAFAPSSVLYGCMPLEYANGDVKLLSKVSIASASIPMVVTEHDIGGLKYSDGGAAYATPLPPFSDELYRICTGRNQMKKMQETMILPHTKCTKCEKIMKKKGKCRSKRTPNRHLRLIYFSCQDMELCPDEEGLFGKFKGISSIIASIMIQDRAAAITLLEKIGCRKDIEYKFYTQLKTSDLSNIFTHLKDMSHYVMCLFPNERPRVDIFNFVHEDISSLIKTVRGNYNMHLWYIE